MNDFKPYRGRGRGSHYNYRGPPPNNNFNNDMRRPHPNHFQPFMPTNYRETRPRWQRPPHNHYNWRAPPIQPPFYQNHQFNQPNQPQTMRPRLQKPPVPTRPLSPLPGSEEARQKAIAEASARIKEQLNLNENGESNQNKLSDETPAFSTKPCQEPEHSFSVQQTPYVEDPQLSNKPPEKITRKRVRKSTNSMQIEGVEELRKKILTQFTYMSKGKIQNLVNNPGSTRYDAALQHLVRDMRLHLSSELRNMYNNRDNEISHQNNMIDHFNSIVPDLGIELVSLPDTMVAELSKILQFDINNDLVDTNHPNDDCVLIEPEDMFKQAERLLSSTAFLESGESSNFFPDSNLDSSNPEPDCSIYESANFDDSDLKVENESSSNRNEELLDKTVWSTPCARSPNQNETQYLSPAKSFVSNVSDPFVNRSPVFNCPPPSGSAFPPPPPPNPVFSHPSPSTNQNFMYPNLPYQQQLDNNCLNQNFSNDITFDNFSNDVSDSENTIQEVVMSDENLIRENETTPEFSVNTEEECYKQEQLEPVELGINTPVHSTPVSKFQAEYFNQRQQNSPEIETRVSVHNSPMLRITASPLSLKLQQESQIMNTVRPSSRESSTYTNNLATTQQETIFSMAASPLSIKFQQESQSMNTIRPMSPQITPFINNSNMIPALTSETFSNQQPNKSSDFQVASDSNNAKIRDASPNQTCFNPGKSDKTKIFNYDSVWVTKPNIPQIPVPPVKQEFNSFEEGLQWLETFNEDATQNSNSHNNIPQPQPVNSVQEAPKEIVQHIQPEVDRSRSKSQESANITSFLLDISSQKAAQNRKQNRKESRFDRSHSNERSGDTNRGRQSRDTHKSNHENNQKYRSKARSKSPYDSRRSAHSSDTNSPARPSLDERIRQLMGPQQTERKTQKDAVLSKRQMKALNKEKRWQMHLKNINMQNERRNNPKMPLPENKTNHNNVQHSNLPSSNNNRQRKMSKIARQKELKLLKQNNIAVPVNMPHVNTSDRQNIQRPTKAKVALLPTPGNKSFKIAEHSSHDQVSSREKTVIDNSSTLQITTNANNDVHSNKNVRNSEQSVKSKIPTRTEPTLEKDKTAHIEQSKIAEAPNKQPIVKSISEVSANSLPTLNPQGKRSTTPNTVVLPVPESNSIVPPEKINKVKLDTSVFESKNTTTIKEESNLSQTEHVHCKEKSANRTDSVTKLLEDNVCKKSEIQNTVEGTEVSHVPLGSQIQNSPTEIASEVTPTPAPVVSSETKTVPLIQDTEKEKKTEDNNITTSTLDSESVEEQITMKENDKNVSSKEKNETSHQKLDSSKENFVEPPNIIKIEIESSSSDTIVNDLSFESEKNISDESIILIDNCSKATAKVIEEENKVITITLDDSSNETKRENKNTEEVKGKNENISNENQKDIFDTTSKVEEPNSKQVIEQHTSIQESNTEKSKKDGSIEKHATVEENSSSREQSVERSTSKREHSKTSRKETSAEKHSSKSEDSKEKTTSKRESSIEKPSKGESSIEKSTSKREKSVEKYKNELSCESHSSRREPSIEKHNTEDRTSLKKEQSVEKPSKRESSLEKSTSKREKSVEKHRNETSSESHSSRREPSIEKHNTEDRTSSKKEQNIEKHASKREPSVEKHSTDDRSSSKKRKSEEGFRSSSRNDSHSKSNTSRTRKSEEKASSHHSDKHSKHEHSKDKKPSTETNKHDKKPSTENKSSKIEENISAKDKDKVNKNNDLHEKSSGSKTVSRRSTPTFESKTKSHKSNKNEEHKKSEIKPENKLITNKKLQLDDKRSKSLPKTVISIIPDNLDKHEQIPLRDPKSSTSEYNKTTKGVRKKAIDIAKSTALDKNNDPEKRSSFRNDKYNNYLSKDNSGNIENVIEEPKTYKHSYDDLNKTITDNQNVSVGNIVQDKTISNIESITQQKREEILKRMMAVDTEIQKLMQEKWSLYAELQMCPSNAPVFIPQTINETTIASTTATNESVCTSSKKRRLSTTNATEIECVPTVVIKSYTAPDFCTDKPQMNPVVRPVSVTLSETSITENTLLEESRPVSAPSEFNLIQNAKQNDSSDSESETLLTRKRKLRAKPFSKRKRKKTVTEKHPIEPEVLPAEAPVEIIKPRKKVTARKSLAKPKTPDIHLPESDIEQYQQPQQNKNLRGKRKKVEIQQSKDEDEEDNNLLIGFDLSSKEIKACIVPNEPLLDSKKPKSKRTRSLKQKNEVEESVDVIVPVTEKLRRARSMSKEVSDNDSKNQRVKTIKSDKIGQVESDDDDRPLIEINSSCAETTTKEEPEISQHANLQTKSLAGPACKKKPRRKSSRHDDYTSELLETIDKTLELYSTTNKVATTPCFVQLERVDIFDISKKIKSTKNESLIENESQTADKSLATNESLEENNLMVTDESLPEDKQSETNKPAMLISTSPVKIISEILDSIEESQNNNEPVTSEISPEPEDSNDSVVQDDKPSTEEDVNVETKPEISQVQGIDEGVFCEGHKKSILDIKIVGEEFLAASEDGTIYKYCLKTGHLQDAYTGHKRAVTCMHVVNGQILNIDSMLLYSGSLDCSMKCYNLDTAEVVHSVTVEQAIQCMDSAWGHIFLGTYDGLLFIYNIKKKLLNEQSLTVASATVLMVKATQEGSRQVLIVASRKREIMVRDAFSGLLLRTMGQDERPTIYSLHLDRSLVYCGTSDKGILVIDFNNGSTVRSYHAGKGVVCMLMHRDLLFAGCYDGLVYVYSTRTHEHVATLPGPGEGMLLSLAITPNGKIIAGTKKDHLLKIWKIPQEILNECD